MRARFIKVKSIILISILGFLGFTSCGDDDDIQPEYGVRIVRDKQVQDQQQENDAILQNEVEKTEKPNNE